MRDSKNIFMQEFRSRPVAYSVQIVGVVVILLNIWLSTKLFPMAQSIDAIIGRVKAAETEIMELKIDAETDEQILGEIRVINTKIDDVKTRIERIDTRLSKHLGI